MKNSRRIVLVILCLLIFKFSSYSQTAGSFVFDGIKRTFIVHVPSGWSPENKYPLLISLHGLTQTGNEMMTFTGFNSYADEYGFIVVYPDGVSNSWNVGFIAGSDADDVGFLSALIDSIDFHYSVNLNRVYATGFSNGGFMSYRLACELGNRIAAIASVSGTMTDGSLGSCLPERRIPVMHIHGTSDVVVFYNGGFGNASVNEVLSFWKEENDCPFTATILDLPDLVADGSSVQKQVWSPCSDSTEVTLYRVVGGGHTWPGSVGTTGTGITNRDINASDEIWKFVSRFHLQQNTTSIMEFPSNGIQIFPNPATSKEITIVIPTVNESIQLEILTLDGKKLCSTSIAAGNTSTVMNLTNVVPGLYLLKAIRSNKVNFSKLLIR